MSVAEHVWDGRDNYFTLMFVVEDGADKTPLDMSTVTTITLDLEPTGPSLTVNYQEAGALIDWWDASLSTGECLFKLGTWVDLPSGALATFDCRLTVYSATYPNGMIWASINASNVASMKLTVHPIT